MPAHSLIRRAVSLGLLAPLVLPLAVGAQGIRRRPGVDRRTPPPAAPLPPAQPIPVARDLAYKRLRWSADAYSLVSAVEVPGINGGTTRFTSVGAGTHGDYRLTDHTSATVDVTTSLFGDPVDIQTAEVGGRFSPLTWEQRARPFFDLRAAYARLYDPFTTQNGQVLGNLDGVSAGGGRYSRGVGGIVGAGFEYTLTRRFALTTELLAFRGRMNVYRVDDALTLPVGTNYWTTSYRYTLGLKFSPVRALSLKQNPAG